MRVAILNLFRQLGEYRANGFAVPGESFGLDAQSSLVINLTRDCLKNSTYGNCRGNDFIRECLKDSTSGNCLR